ncbi:MAG: hypothetical protein JST16_06455 [Bdellovibrionales bacterium]|nr:hypothetical protein [Bdellovibrionales bacterium]
MSATKIDAKAIREKLLKEESDRGKVSLYLSKKLYKSFQKACGTLPASKVVEELMQAFVDSAS